MGRTATVKRGRRRRDRRVNRRRNRTRNLAVPLPPQSIEASLTVGVDANTFMTNPGPCAIAAIALDREGRELARTVRYIGHTTNNVGEWTALVEGLRLARSLPEWSTAKAVVLFSDSELVVNQANGRWRTQAPELQRLHAAWRGLYPEEREPSVYVLWRPEAEHSTAHDAAEEELRAQVEAGAF